MAAIDKSQETVDGVVTMQLFKGHAYAVARTSELSLYNPEMSSFDAVGGYNQEDAAGFIKINAIRLKAHYAIQSLKKAV